jgi:hypothetical protein
MLRTISFNNCLSFAIAMKKAGMMMMASLVDTRLPPILWLD